MPPEGIASYLLMDFSDLMLGALDDSGGHLRPDAPARRSSSVCGTARQLWGRMFWNKFKVEITVALWSLLLFVPGHCRDGETGAHRRRRRASKENESRSRSRAAAS